MKTNKLFTLFWLLLAPVQVAGASELSEVQSWLKKMHHAIHMSNYEGIFVYGQADQLSSMRIIHGVDGNGHRERLISMDGSGREVLRDGNRVTCILPDTRSVVVEQSRNDNGFPPVFPIEIGNLANFYELSLAGKGTVAGEPVQKILITPRDNLRYGHALWVHDQTGLLLKTHLLDEQGRPVEQFMFTQIRFLDSVPEAKLQSTINKQNFTWYQAEEPSLPAGTANTPNPGQWRVNFLPPGFVQDSHRKHTMPVGATPVEHQVYSDGLASVSVFIERNSFDGHEPMLGSSQMGAVSLHGRRVEEYMITVMGELPQEAVRRIGESIEFIPGHD